MVKTMRSFKQAVNAIKKATYNTQLSMNERCFYRWIETQHRHRHLFHTFEWSRGASLSINQKRKR